MSQATFALALNVSAIIVSRWERGEVRPSGPSLKLLALARKKGIDRHSVTQKGPRPVKTAIAYTRVSTASKGRSGLGLEAQQAALARFAEAEGFDL